MKFKQIASIAVLTALLNCLYHQCKYFNLNIRCIDEFVRTGEGAVISAIWFWFSWARLPEAAKAITLSE